MTLAIEIADDRWLGLENVETWAEAAATRALRTSGASDGPGEVSVLLANDKEMQVLNKQWRGKDQSTNVLSFPAVVPPDFPKGEARPLGDIILAYETVQSEAQAQGKPVLHHMSHLIVHGVLHLLGYDHLAENQADQMESREREILADLGIADPYLERT
jgi:probable rRNA maturation factor